MIKVKYDEILQNLELIKLNPSDKEKLRALIMSYYNNALFNAEKIYANLDLIDKKLLSKNIDINRSYVDSIEKIRRSAQVGIDKNNSLAVDYTKRAEEKSLALKFHLDEIKKNSNKRSDFETKAFDRLLQESNKVFQDEIQQINKEKLLVIKKRDKINNEIIEVNTVETNMTIDKYMTMINALQTDLSNLNINKDSAVKAEINAYENERKNQEIDYLSIKKTASNSYRSFNNYINSERKKVVETKKSEIIGIENKINDINIELASQDNIFNKNKDAMQSKYFEKIKALNIVFDVQKNDYNSKVTTLINNNNEKISAINSEYKNRKKVIQDKKDLLEKNKWLELSKTKDKSTKKIVLNRYKTLEKAIEKSILNEERNFYATNKSAKESFYKKQLKLDYDHVKQINSWRYKKSLYDYERTIELAKITMQHDLTLQRLNENKTYLNTLKQLTIKNLELNSEHKISLIETQLKLSSFIHNREIALLENENDFMKKHHNLNIKKIENAFAIKVLDYKTQISKLESILEHEKSSIAIKSQLEIQKQILNSDHELFILNTNIKIQEDLLALKKQKFTNLLESTLSKESLTIKKESQVFDYEVKLIHKEANLEREKRNAIISVIRNKTQSLISAKKNYKNIAISKITAEKQEDINNMFFGSMTNDIFNIELFLTEIIQTDCIIHPSFTKIISEILLPYVSIINSTSLFLIDKYIEVESTEFEKMIFDLTDQKYRVKHEEILNLFTENTSEFVNKQKETEAANAMIEASINDFKSRIFQNKSLIQSNRKAKLPSYRQRINEIINDNIQLKYDLTLNTKIYAKNKKKIAALKKTFNNYDLRKSDEELKISVDKKKEITIYRSLFNSHMSRLSDFKTYCNTYFVAFNNDFSTINTIDAAFIKRKINSIKEFKDYVLAIKNYALQFWMDVYHASSNEQRSIISNFDMSTTLSIKQIDEAYDKILHYENSEISLIKKNYQADIENTNNELKQLNDTTALNIKLLNIDYEKKYSLGERAIKEGYNILKKKISLTNINLNTALIELKQKMDNSISNDKLASSNSLSSYRTINETIMSDFSIIDRNQSNKSLYIIDKFNYSKKSLISKNRTTRKTILNTIERNKTSMNKALIAFENKLHQYNKEYSDYLAKTEYDHRVFSFKEKLNQISLTKKEAKNFKKSIYEKEKKQ